MKDFILEIGGTEYVAERPKLKHLKKTLKISKEINKSFDDNAIDEITEFFCDVLKADKEKLQEDFENMDLELFMAKFMELSEWITSAMGSDAKANHPATKN